MGINLVVGRNYLLIISPTRLFESDIRLEGRYFGYNPVVTPWYLKPESAEGHIFARKSSSEGVELFVVRTSNRRVKMCYISDGEDEPSFPAGISAERLDIKLQKAEQEFILSRLSQQEEPTRQDAI